MPTLQLKNLTYYYQDGESLYQNHELLLEPIINNSMLYGIIGPSGGGKTTLLNILGGQLKPKEGSVLVNGIDIYSINDEERQKLLGVQMQTSSSLRGELRYNLIFGLNEIFIEEYCTDEKLQDLLIKVGLWKLFVGKAGLSTLIGEGGINLSGGQRQRLNFASLYLRTKCYSPSLLLIDEPTSSLDAISERAITDMILELSKDAITLVVAHRLNTLEKAVGILDISLLSSSSKLQFYNKNELIKHSKYYQELLNGTALLN